MASISSDNTGQQNRKFAGKEFIEMHGYDMLDLGARLYDFVHFPTPDPLMEKKPWISPYVYCSGNPLNSADPDGLDDYSVNQKGVIGLVKKTEDKTDRLIWVKIIK